MKLLRLAISPCPNDTLMFHKLLHEQYSDMSFDLEFADIEELNLGLKSAKWDVAKMSVAAYPMFMDEYEMLPVGMAMGFANGPLLISSERNVNLDNFEGELLIPGKYTTANALLSKFFPHIQNKKEMLFSDIPNAIAEKKAKLGLIIHESRFTYQNLSLHKIIDLGELWEQKMNLPLPLGAIVLRRSLTSEIKIAIKQILQNSIRKGLENSEPAMPFILSHSAEKNPNIVQKHINLYVNEFSIDAGKDGREAVLSLLMSIPKNDSLTLQEIFLK